MKIKESINKIVASNNRTYMDNLSEMLESALYTIKEYDCECFNKYKKELLAMAYNYQFNEELAKDIVENMKPRGEYWDLSTINQVKNQYGVSANLYDFYVVMNSMANDYGNVIDLDDVETYVKLSLAFINDTDAEDNKVWTYFMTIPKDL